MDDVETKDGRSDMPCLRMFIILHLIIHAFQGHAKSFMVRLKTKGLRDLLVADNKRTPFCKHLFFVYRRCKAIDLVGSIKVVAKDREEQPGAYVLIKRRDHDCVD